MNKNIQCHLYRLFYTRIILNSDATYNKTVTIRYPVY